MHTRVILAREFGWTLDYIDTLGADEVITTLAVLSGEAKGRTKPK